MIEFIANSVQELGQSSQVKTKIQKNFILNPEIILERNTDTPFDYMP